MFSDQHVTEEIGYGAFVQLTGLVGSKQYNGRVGRVENDRPVEDSHGILRLQVALVNVNKILKVRPSNVVLSGDSPEWARSETNNESILEFLRTATNPFHSMHVCHKFGLAMWKLFFDPAPNLCLPFDSKFFQEFKQMITSSPHHSLMVVDISAVGHVFVVEMKGNGRFRIYQSYIKRDVEAHLLDSSFGFTVGEWCSPSSSSSMREHNEAYARYGGGKTLSAAELGEFLDLVHEWQALTVELLESELLQQVPEKVLARPMISRLAARAASWVDAHQDMFGAASNAVVDWSKSLQHRLVSEGITTVHPCSEGEDYLILVGTEQVFSISQNRFDRCNKVNMKMTGQAVMGGTFLKMLEWGIFWEAKHYKDADGMNKFTGFTFQAGKLQ